MSSENASESENDSFSGSDDEPRRKKTDRTLFLKKYENIRSKLRIENSEAHKGEASALVLDHLNELKQIYQEVQNENNRDTTVHLKDSEAFKDTASFAAVNARNIKLGDMGLSLGQKDLVRHIKAYMNADFLSEEVQNDEDGDVPDIDTFNCFNWIKLGLLSYTATNKAVLSEFLYGPLATERKKAGPRTRNIDDTRSGNVVTAKNVQVSDISNDAEQNTAHMVKSVYSTFSRKSNDEKINFFKFFINPNSFSQSVENLFFTSFLIKDARVKLTKDADGVPMIQRATNIETLQANTKERVPRHAHHIATFDYKTWKGLINTFDITECFLGHRDDPEDEFHGEIDSDSEIEDAEENERFVDARNGDMIQDNESQISRTGSMEVKDEE